MFLSLRRERSLALDRGDEVGFFRGRSRKRLGGDFSPRESLRILREVVDRGLVEETSVDESLDEFGETLVSKGSSNDGLRLRNLVALSERSGVSVGVSDKGLK